jgi:hypothetical protein
MCWPGGPDDEGELGDNGGNSASETPVKVHLPKGLVATALGAGAVAESIFAIVHGKSS